MADMPAHPPPRETPRFPGPGPVFRLPVSPIPAVNVASVPQRSPLRYPGGKTWLVPHIRAWLRKADAPSLLIEPFAGGGIVSLTAVMEGLVDRCLMIEIDADVAAFWQSALRHGPELCARIIDFEPTREAVYHLAETKPETLLDHGFRTLVLNRTRRGGILAPGASLPRVGENGRGVTSRWYPETLVDRIRAIGEHADRIAFCTGDGAGILEAIVAARISDAAIFVDPPYTARGKRAGKRLYKHNEIDHAALFRILAGSNVSFLMTYDLSPEVIDLISIHGFHAAQVLMKTTHHTKLPELVITRDRTFGT
ncbi:MAG: DNA adenine methylase [Rhodobacter sp.]|nr:DNA adenine methylase [Rhodobacter sp.]MCY4241186.1 DNA adenine methylase [Rhodobacter sp.]